MNTQNPKPTTTQPQTRQRAVLFDHEKLNVYQRELQFISWVTPVLEEAKASGPGRSREVCDQLDRASLSSLLNTAEGNGKRRGQLRARYFDDARGSSTECAACLDALVAKGVISPDKIAEGKMMLFETVSMLCGLVDRFDESGCQCHEEDVVYKIGQDLKTNPRARKTNRSRKTR
jgi:four helix bundle protein